MSMFSEKQQEFLNNADRRWNVKYGATRSGKTYLDYYVIPKRIRKVANLPRISSNFRKYKRNFTKKCNRAFTKYMGNRAGF